MIVLKDQIGRLLREQRYQEVLLLRKKLKVL